MRHRMIWVPALAATAAMAGVMAAAPADARLASSASARTGVHGTAPVIVRPTPWRVVYTNRIGRPDLRGIAAVNSHAIWAVGDRPSGPFAAHWNGRRWKPSSIPHPRGFNPQFISAPSDSDVWVFGVLPSGHTSAVQWDGSSWHTVRLPAIASDLGVVFNPSDIWLLSDQHVCSLSGCVITVLHWNGSVWTQSSVRTGSVAAIGGTPDGDLWLIGMDNIHRVGDQTHAEMVGFRWNGHSWRAVAHLPRIEVADTPSLTVASARNVWVSALRAKRRRNGEQPDLGVHWNGQRWTVLTVPDNLADLGPIATDGGQGLWFGPDLHWTGRKWIEEVGRWLPSWANPFAGVGISHVPGTRTVVLAVVSQGGTLIGANRPLRG
jgi:hypothetical protein